MNEKTYILAIDTTTPDTGIGILGNKLTKIKTWISEHNQSQELLPKIDQLLRTNRVKPAQIKWVAINLGPGSFTGLRVGVSTANAFGYGLQIPIIGRSNLSGSTKERVQQLLMVNNPTQPPLAKGRSEGIKKFRQVLPVYGSPPHITKPRHS